MKKFRSLYEFNISKKVPTKETSEQEINGEKVSVTKDVVKDTPIPFALKKPSREMYDSADLFYNVEIGKGLEAGMMSAALLAKKFANNGGVFSEPEKEEYGEKFLEFFEIEEELQEILKTPKDQRSEEQQNRFRDLIKNKGVVTRELQSYEIREQNLFSITAEARARTKTIVWWLLNLLHEQVENEWVPFFVGETHKEKQKFYDELDGREDLSEEDRDFLAQVTNRAARAIAIWYFNRNITTEGIDQELKRQDMMSSNTFYVSQRTEGDDLPATDTPTE